MRIHFVIALLILASSLRAQTRLTLDDGSGHKFTQKVQTLGAPWTGEWPTGPGTSGYALITNGATPALFSWAPLSTGSVTSVGLSLPASLFTVTGSPVTSSGTLTGTLAVQNANLVFAGPTSGAAAAPTFRALVAADVPSGSGNYIQNGTSLQTSASYNIDGTGVVGKLLVGAGTYASPTGWSILQAGQIDLHYTTLDFWNSAGTAFGALKGNFSSAPISGTPTYTWQFPAVTGTIPVTGSGGGLLTAGTGVTITNGSGVTTIAATGTSSAAVLYDPTTASPTQIIKSPGGQDIVPLTLDNWATNVSDLQDWDHAGTVEAYMSNSGFMYARGYNCSPGDVGYELVNNAATHNGIFSLYAGDLTANQTWTPPDASGVLTVTGANGGLLTAGTGITITDASGATTITATGGSVTSFSATGLAALFTTSVINATTTPALSFSPVPVTDHQFYAGVIGSGSAAPAWRTIAASDLPTITNSMLPGSGAIDFTSTGGTLTAPGSIALGGTANYDIDLTHANTWTGVQTFQNATDIGAADNAVISLNNIVPATSIHAEFPPGIQSEGQYWNGTTSATVYGYEGMDIEPITGTAVSKSYIWRIGGISPPIVATLSDAGVYSTTGAMLANGAGLVTHAGVSLKDSHIQSQQTTAPTATPQSAGCGTAGTGGTAATATLTHATDVAGIAAVSTTNGAAFPGGINPVAGAIVAVTFNLSYVTAPIVTLTPADAGTEAIGAYVSSVSTTGFVISVAGVPPGGAVINYKWFYHAIETQ